MYRIGVILSFPNTGVTSDQTSAQWDKQAADLGHSGAITNYGYVNFVSEPLTEENCGAFLEYTNRAIALDEPMALHNMGAAYATGRCVQQNPEQARQLFKQAANLGFGESMGAQWVVKTRTPPAEGISDYKKAAAAGCGRAASILGAVYMSSGRLNAFHAISQALMQLTPSDSLEKQLLDTSALFEQNLDEEVRALRNNMANQLVALLNERKKLAESQPSVPASGGRYRHPAGHQEKLDDLSAQIMTALQTIEVL